MMLFIIYYVPQLMESQLNQLCLTGHLYSPSLEKSEAGPMSFKTYHTKSARAYIIFLHAVAPFFLEYFKLLYIITTIGREDEQIPAGHDRRWDSASWCSVSDWCAAESGQDFRTSESCRASWAWPHTTAGSSKRLRPSTVPSTAWRIRASPSAGVTPAKQPLSN